jgi:hypothetical protein
MCIEVLVVASTQCPITALATAQALAPMAAIRMRSAAGKAHDTPNPSGVRSVTVSVPGCVPASTGSDITRAERAA